MPPKKLYKNLEKNFSRVRKKKKSFILSSTNSNKNMPRKTSYGEIFLYGLIGGFLALILQIASELFINNFLKNFTIFTRDTLETFFILTPFTLFLFVFFEEMVKYILLRKLVIFPSFVNIFSISFVFGLGFFSLEIFLSSLGENFFFHPFHFFILCIHSITSLFWLLGIYFSEKHSRKLFIFLGGFFALAIHALYNMLVYILMQ